MPERTVKIKAHSYLEEIEDPRRPGETIRVDRVARKGETVDFPEAEVERGERLGAFVTEGEEAATADSSALSVEQMDDEELESWIREKKPTVQQVVEASGGNPEIARRLYDAELAASGGDPRQGVVEGLAAVISRENE